MRAHFQALARKEQAARDTRLREQQATIPPWDREEPPSTSSPGMAAALRGEGSKASIGAGGTGAAARPPRPSLAAGGGFAGAPAGAGPAPDAGSSGGHPRRQKRIIEADWLDAIAAEAEQRQAGQMPRLRSPSPPAQPQPTAPRPASSE